VSGLPVDRRAPRRLRLLGGALLALLTGLAVTGCQSLAFLPPVDVVQPSAALPLPAPMALVDPLRPVHPSGAIFQADRYRPLFETPRARLVGDIITVNIAEKVSAVQKSTSTLDRAGAVDSSISAAPFLKSSALTRAAAAGSSSNTFSGKGTTENSNDFSGVITATVVQLLPNGHMIISAEKQIGVNANVDVLRFSGQVDPTAIAPGNQVQSTQIANVRIEQRGRGQAAEVQSVGWLSRFFLNVLPI